MPLKSQFRQLNRVSYWAFGRAFPNYKQDLCWDNFNGQMPEKYAKGYVCRLRTNIYPSEVAIDKYIVYAGFFGESSEQSQILGEALGVPVARAKKRFKTPLNSHLVAHLIQPDMAYLPLASGATAGESRALMLYNDSISPISSQLWLGRYLEGTAHPIPPDTDWALVQDLKNSRNARLFEGVDHGDWLKGTTRNRDKDGKLLDWLHPDQPSRDVYTWIVTDLMR